MRSDVDRHDAVVVPFLGFIAAAVFMVGIVMLQPNMAFASDPRAVPPAASGAPPGRNAQPPCRCGQSADQAAGANAADSAGDIRASLDHFDQLAVVQAMHLALTDVGDGQSYVWHRSHGRLSGVVYMTGSYKNGGTLCRRLTVILTAGAETRQTATAACRLADRSWLINAP